MADLPTLLADLENLKRVRRTGAREVQYSDGRRSSFGTDKELATAIAATEAEIARAQGAGGTRNVVVRSSKGW